MPSRPSGEKADLWAGGAVTRPHSQLAGVTAGVGPAVSDFKADLFSALWTDPHFPCSLGCRCSSYSSGREHETWISTRRLREARTGRPSRTRGAPGRGTKPRCLGAQKVRPHLGAGGWGPAEPWKGTGPCWAPTSSGPASLSCLQTSSKVTYPFASKFSTSELRAVPPPGQPTAGHRSAYGMLPEIMLKNRPTCDVPAKALKPPH